MRPKHRRFVAEYLIDSNATASAIRAGYSERTSRTIGPRLLQNVAIAEAVREGQSRIAKSLDITAERVLKELARLAYLDPRSFYDADGDLIPIQKLDEDTARCIAGIEYEKLYEHFAKGQAKPVGTTSKIKFADKGQNLERLGRHLKLFTEKIELTGDTELISRLAAGRKRLQQ